MNNFAMTIMTFAYSYKRSCHLEFNGRHHDSFSYFDSTNGCAVKRLFIVYLALNEIFCVVSDKTDYFDAFRDARFAIFQLSLFVFA